MERQILDSIESVGQEQWEKLQSPDFPFTDFSNLINYERSGSVGPGTGWTPRPITLWQQQQLVAACPVYIKSDSYGEYIFDWEWAEAYHSRGFEYYPKAISAIPFTPATGRKLLGNSKHHKALIQSCEDLCQQQGFSSFHFMFLTEDELDEFEQKNWSVRHSFQFHWKNQGYANFSDFLCMLRSKRRKEIIRERKRILEQGLEVRILAPEEVTLETVHKMYEFYRINTQNKSGMPYLTRAYFENLVKLQIPVIVVEAKNSAGKVIAMSISFKKGENLYGRYWGCIEEFECLHFELCYYKLIEYCIEHNIKLLEAGAQGPHKIHRGFLPCLTYSAHYIVDPEFRAAIDRFIQMEKRQLAVALETFKSPYKD